MGKICASVESVSLEISHECLEGLDNLLGLSDKTRPDFARIVQRVSLLGIGRG